MLIINEIAYALYVLALAGLLYYVGKNIKKSIMAFDPEKMKLTPEDTAELEQEIQ